MKKQCVAFFLLAALTMTILAGCQSESMDLFTKSPVSALPMAYAQVPGTTATPETQPPTQATVPSTPENSMLTPQEAEAIALAHAQIPAEQAQLERTELDRDMGSLHYEVEFRAGDYEYDYEIDAITGQVRRWEREYDPIQTQKPTEPPATEPATPPVTEPTIKLTAKEAEALALAHAGLQAADVRFERTELDYERGVAHYEVEFRYGNWEYSYEIHAETGKILEWEKEWDD